MRSTRLCLLLVFVASFVVVACGGGDDGPGTTPDAPVVTPDAPPAGLTGLGQKCGAGLPACPANATECIQIQGTNNSFCTPKCVTGGTAVGGTDGLTMIQPAPNNSCMTSYTGSVGMGMCAVILAFQPMDNPIVQGKNYTNVEIGCAVICGAGACPAGLAPVTLGPGCVCIPQ